VFSLEAVMHAKKLHLHSMLVHAVLALVPLAALTYLAEAFGVRVGSFGAEVWHFVTRAALVVVLLTALPATASGILERRHSYVTWHATHKVKMAASVALVGLVAVELVVLARGVGAELVLGVMVVGFNPLAALLLGAYGLKMTLGRQSLAATSYRPDLLMEPPIDVLAATAARLAEPADLIDVLGEGIQ
jgi:hypothetical protein